MQERKNGEGKSLRISRWDKKSIATVLDEECESIGITGNWCGSSAHAAAAKQRKSFQMRRTEDNVGTIVQSEHFRIWQMQAMIDGCSHCGRQPVEQTFISPITDQAQSCGRKCRMDFFPCSQEDRNPLARRETGHAEALSRFFGNGRCIGKNKGHKDIGRNSVKVHDSIACIGRNTCHLCRTHKHVPLKRNEYSFPPFTRNRATLLHIEVIDNGMDRHPFWPSKEKNPTGAHRNKNPRNVLSLHDRT